MNRYIQNMSKLRENYGVYLHIYDIKCSYSGTQYDVKFHLGKEPQKPVISHGCTQLEQAKLLKKSGFETIWETIDEKVI